MWLLVFARCVVLWSHYTGRPLLLSGPTVVVKVIVVVGCGCGHRKHSRHVEVHVCGNREGPNKTLTEGRKNMECQPVFVELLNKVKPLKADASLLQYFLRGGQQPSTEETKSYLDSTQWANSQGPAQAAGLGLKR